MSQRQDKKLRQMYARAIEAQAAKKVAQWGEVIKPKPTWMPHWLYRWCLRVVLR